MEESSSSIDPQLWQACAGSMAEIPSLNSAVFYFPQGHCEHASEAVDFSKIARVPPPYIPCRVSAVHHMADHDNDEVFLKMRLMPLDRNPFGFDDSNDDDSSASQPRSSSVAASFAKTLTQSDANNGGGFSVPRYCAETIFPKLDYSADPPVQSIVAMDIHGRSWKFRHIYRGTPRRHLLTTGWSSFVNSKSLVAGDSIVFVKTDDGHLRVGIRRSKRGGWNPNPNRENGRRRVRAEDVLRAVALAADGEEFEVVYYPCGSTPEFCVRAAVVKAAMEVGWGSGMRFKMAFETEDSSRISWFVGTVASVQVADPVKWPGSPWRLLLVNWDEPDLLHNVKRVNPWLVEPVTASSSAFNMNGFPMSSSSSSSSFSPPFKKLRFTAMAEAQEFSRFGYHHQIMGVASRSSFVTPAGMQGARHPPRYGVSMAASSYFGQQQQHPLSISIKPSSADDEPATVTKKTTSAPFLLFGQPILTDEQITRMGFEDDGTTAVGIDLNRKNRDEPLPVLDGQCKVFLGSEDVGRSLDLPSLGSYDELRRKVGVLLGGEATNLIVYSDSKGAVKQLGDEPFLTFMRSARRLTILSDTRNCKNND
ncbi:hypothetical protein M569_08201, partial [Genlisea aurea]